MPKLFSQKIRIYKIVALFTFSAAVCIASPELKPFIITIDPGHGGADNGAVYGPAREADIALEVAKQLQNNLNAVPGIQAYLTREKDISISLQDRVEKSSEKKSDLFVSLHTNASPDQRARGVEFYFQNQMAADEESMYLAHLENQMQKETKETLAQTKENLDKKSDVLAIIGDLKRQAYMKQSYLLSDILQANWSPKVTKAHSSIRQAPFYVVSKTDSPSVLVELGFISNPKESQKLLQATYKRELAQRLLKGLLSYKEIIDKSKPARLQ